MRAPRRHGVRHVRASRRCRSRSASRGDAATGTTEQSDPWPPRSSRTRAASKDASLSHAGRRTRSRTSESRLPVGRRVRSDGPVDTDVQIVELDTTDPAARAAWHDVMEQAARSDRPHALVTTSAAFEVTATSPSTHYSRTWLQAVEGGEVIGVAELELPLSENTDVAWAEVQVLPTHRRRGVGRALWQAVVERARAADRTRVGGEVTVDVAAPGPAREFAAAMGTVDKHREDHLVADLPVATSPVDPAYDVRVAAARRRADGTFGGYSLLFVPHGTDYGWQDDTLVMPEHRGHRLGAALKTANYADLPDDVRLVHTWTAPSNTAMHRTNTTLGFRVVEHMYEVEAPIA